MKSEVEERIRRRFEKGCTQYGLLQDGDRILAAISGGKDSLTMLRLLAQRSRIFKPRIQVEAAHILIDNIPYHTDTTYLLDFCDDLGIPLHVLRTSFEERESERRQKTKCFLCSWYRRKKLLEFATEEGFNKVALGHHMDDILTTLLMNLTYEGAFQTMPPALPLEHYPVTLIRPLCLVDERDIRTAAGQLRFRRQTAVCPYEDTTRRTAMNRVFHQLETLNPEARYIMWKALSNIKHDLLPGK